MSHFRHHYRDDRPRKSNTPSPLAELGKWDCAARQDALLTALVYGRVHDCKVYNLSSHNSRIEPSYMQFVRPQVINNLVDFGYLVAVQDDRLLGLDYSWYALTVGGQRMAWEVVRWQAD